MCFCDKPNDTLRMTRSDAGKKGGQPREAGFRACICRLPEATFAGSPRQHVQTPEATRADSGGCKHNKKAPNTLLCSGLLVKVAATYSPTGVQYHRRKRA